MKCEKWTDQHDMSVGERKIVSPQQESNPWPPEHWAGAPSTDDTHGDLDSADPSSMQDACHIWTQLYDLASDSP